MLSVVNVVVLEMFVVCECFVFDWVVLLVGMFDLVVVVECSCVMCV